MQYDSYSQEETHMVQAIVGANWGDEGKGKITDMLAEKADIIVRFQGGANAGHTIVNNYGKFALHTLPSGVFYSHTTSIIGNGVALDIPVLINELNSIVERGVPMPKLLISDRAQIVMPYHILFDKYEEERLAGKSFGSTKSGIAPFYSDKYAKIGFQVNELFDEERLLGKLKDVCEKKNVMLEHLYHKPLLVPEEILETLKEYREMVKPFVCNTSLYLWNALKEGKTVLFVGTKKQAQESVKEEAIRCGAYYVNARWLGGMLTNFTTIRRRVNRLKQLREMQENGTFDLLPKKEVIKLNLEIEKLEKFLGGIKDMKDLPGALFIVDPRKEKIAVAEAKKLGIPIIAIVDTNCDPDEVDYVIPGNDDAIRAVKLLAGVMANGVIEGKEGQMGAAAIEAEDEMVENLVVEETVAE